MELRQYWRIIWKRAWIPLLLVAVVAGASWLTYQPPATNYTTSLRFTIGVKPQQIEDEYTYDGYYAWVSSEYMADDMSVIVGSQDFAADVNRYLAEMDSSVQVAPGVISGITIAEKQHRILRVNLSWPNPTELAEIGQAVALALENETAKYFAQLGVPEAQLQLIDPPGPPAAQPASLTQRLNIPLRLMLALAAGLALTFLLDYLDDSVRDKADLEAMGISVLGELPRR